MTNLIEDLSQHIKIYDVKMKSKSSIICEVDRIQSVARSIVKRITVKYGNFKISSTTKNVKNLGFTKIIIERI